LPVVETVPIPDEVIPIIRSDILKTYTELTEQIFDQINFLREDPSYYLWKIENEISRFDATG
jgi:hypothetical protein